MENKTLFEKIVAGEIPSTKIYEDDETFAFLDINPSNHGHTLVIPKSPYKNIYEIPDDIGNKLFKVVKKISVAIKKAMKADGINIVMNNDAAAGQIIFHAHIHIIPRFDNDKTGVERYEHKKYSEGQAEEVAEKIKKELS